MEFTCRKMTLILEKYIYIITVTHLISYYFDLMVKNSDFEPTLVIT
jgi:hypothetical protein